MAWTGGQRANVEHDDDFLAADDVADVLSELHDRVALDLCLPTVFFHELASHTGACHRLHSPGDSVRCTSDQTGSRCLLGIEQICVGAFPAPITHVMSIYCAELFSHFDVHEM